MTEARHEQTDRLSLAIDRVGSYLGADRRGERRFSSGRTTLNEPTMPYLGGPSLLDGSRSRRGCAGPYVRGRDE